MKLREYQSSLDRGASRLTEGLWLAVKCMFFMPSLPLPSKLRVWLLRRFGARIGNGVVIRSQIDITFPWRLTVGDDVWIGEGVKILNLAPVSIGNDCCLSQRAFLCTGSHRFDLPGFDLVTKPIVVHDGSWITAGVFVAPGVSIGPNSMCAAGSVVLQDVPANTTVIGNPARPKRRSS
ncbi:WcaF family extracellular polysaccharide biosynthesis acetyltransferase [Rosistilla oblonga]|uniref:WcaF family extracellular polysaccharide biosynthesis acetyltransferase n=1 Tax=Rosistilla oblonga TaxID=2527990 RepID=UPI003A97E468